MPTHVIITWKIGLGCIWDVTSTLPWRDIQWVLNCVGYTVMLQDDNGAISGLTRTLVLEFGSHILKYSTVTVYTDCVDIT